MINENHISKGDDCLILKGLSNKKYGQANLNLIPYYQTGNERYGIYWYIKNAIITVDDLKDKK